MNSYYTKSFPSSNSLPICKSTYIYNHSRLSNVHRKVTNITLRQLYSQNFVKNITALLMIQNNVNSPILLYFFYASQYVWNTPRTVVSCHHNPIQYYETISRQIVIVMPRQLSGGHYIVIYIYIYIYIYNVCIYIMYIVFTFIL